MARDLFGEVSTPSVKLGSQAWYTVPLSIAAHVVVTALLIVLPLASADLLPVPDVVMAFTAPAPVPDPPPPPAAAVASSTARGTTTPVSGAAPKDAPSSIEPETGAPPSVPFGGVDGGIDRIGETVGNGLVNIPEPPAPRQSPTPQPVRPGGLIKYPTKVRHVAPIYPRMAQEARVDGLVILEAVIAADGRVQDVRVLRSKPLLDQAAVDAVRQWRFTPTLLNGIPVPVIMTVTVNFALTR